MHRLARRDRSAFTLIELLVVIAIIGVLMGLVLPSIISARNAARRMSCASHLMQTAIGVATYESTFGAYPPGVVNAGGPISNGKTGYHFGWLAQILPFVDQKNVYDELNFQVAVYDPANDSARSISIALYLCPSDPQEMSVPSQGAALTSYSGCHHDVEAAISTTNHGVLFLNSAIRPENLIDGASQTLLVGEAKIGTTALGWASGSRASLRNTGTAINGAALVASASIPDPVGGFSSDHGGGANFAFCDGSVRFLADTIAPATLKALANRKDGQAISSLSY